MKEYKDIVALEKGYPDWTAMENFIIDHNESVIVAQLLVSAMEEVCSLYKNINRNELHYVRYQINKRK